MPDPTRIDIESYGPGSPFVQRMRGVAIHGDTPFDVPFISHVDGNLYQGGCETGLTLPDEIEHLISLYPWERYRIPARSELETELYVRQYDDDSGDNTALHMLADFAAGCVDRGPTLIHCQAGLNRSARLAALVLMKNGMTADQAIALLRSRRSPAVLCNPHFEKWLRLQ